MPELNDLNRYYGVGPEESSRDSLSVEIEATVTDTTNRSCDLESGDVASMIFDSAQYCGSSIECYDYTLLGRKQSHHNFDDGLDCNV